MTEDTTATNAQAANAASTSALAATTTSSDALAADEPISLEEARKLRSEAINLRKREKEAQALLKGYQDKEEAANLAAMGDLDKERKLHEQTQARLKEQQQKLVEAQVKIAAQSKGVHPDALDLVALALNGKLDASDDDFETKLDKAIDDLLKAKPLLKVAESGTRAAPAIGANSPAKSSTNQAGTLPPGKITLDDLYSNYKK